MPNRPRIAVFARTDADGFAKRLWTCLPSPDYLMVNYRETADLQPDLDNILLIFMNIQDFSPSEIEEMYRLVQNHPYPPEVIGVIDDSDLPRNDIARKTCDLTLHMAELDKNNAATILRHKLHRALGRTELIAQQHMFENFKNALSSSRDAYIVFDTNKKLLFLSDHYKKIYSKIADKLVEGIDVESAYRLMAHDTGLSEDDPIYKEMQNFWLGLAGQAEFELENGMILRMRAAPLSDGGGVIISTTDITQYKRQERELASKTKALEAALTKEREAAQIQQQFISMVSHEFRTPLSIIDGNAQLLMRHITKTDMEAMPKRVKTIRSAVSRLVQMMEGVLSSSLIRSGKMAPKREPFDITDLLQQLCEEQDELSPQNRVILTCDNLPPVVNLDRKLLVLVMTNLLSNAVKYGGENPEVLVHAAVNENKLNLRVADNGVGIPEDEKYKIFDRFYRASTSGSVPGTGIGLSLVREMVMLQNGDITVESEVGRGTEFTISLPL